MDDEQRGNRRLDKASSGKNTRTSHMQKTLRLTRPLIYRNVRGLAAQLAPREALDCMAVLCKRTGIDPTIQIRCLAALHHSSCPIIAASCLCKVTGLLAPALARRD